MRGRGLNRFGGVVATEPEIRPGGSAAKTLVLHDGSVGEHGLLLAIVLQPLIGAQPDAVAVAIDFAASIAGAAARTIALVFRTLRLGAKESDLG